MPVNSIDGRAALQAHMRQLTGARQAAERLLRYPPIPQGIPDRQALVAARRAEVHAELAHIDAGHRRWLREHGEHGERA